MFEGNIDNLIALKTLEYFNYRLMIKEEFVNLDSRPDIKDLYKKSYPSNRLLLEEFQFAHAIYLEMDPRQSIRINLSNKDYSETFNEEGFVNNLKKLDHEGFFDLLYLTTLHPDVSYNSLLFADPFENTLNSDSKLIDQIFNISFGKLVYHFQLEHLFSMITGENAINAKEFRRDLGKKKKDAINFSKNLKLTSNQSLYEIMQERMISSFTFSPNFKGATILYKYLEKVNESLVKNGKNKF